MMNYEWRGNGRALEKIQAARSALANVERASGQARHDGLTQLATQLAAVQLAALLSALIAAGVSLGFAAPLDARELADPLQSAAFGAEALRASALISTMSGFLAALAVGMLGFVVSTTARRSRRPWPPPW